MYSHGSCDQTIVHLNFIKDLHEIDKDEIYSFITSYNELGGKILITQDAVPEDSEKDALHIGIAAAQGADYLLTWNFKHINNAEMKSAKAKVVESCGLVCPQICSPEELGGTSND